MSTGIALAVVLFIAILLREFTRRSARKCPKCKSRNTQFTHSQIVKSKIHQLKNAEVSYNYYECLRCGNEYRRRVSKWYTADNNF